MKEIAAVIGAVVAGTTLVVCGAFGITAFAEHRQCDAIERNASSVTTDWKSWWEGCYVTENGVTVPLDRWRVTGDFE